MKKLLISLSILFLSVIAYANTTRLNLNVPSYQSGRWDIPTNANWNTIDAGVCSLSVYNAITSSTSFTGNVDISSSITLNGSAGNSGQVLTSGGVGFGPTWQTLGTGSNLFINNQSTLQSGATFYVSSGTALNFNSTTMTVSSGTVSNLNASTVTIKNSMILAPQYGTNENWINNVGNDNFFAGFAYAGNSPGTANVAIGSGAGYGLSSPANGNTFIGVSAGQGAGSGSHNTALGESALAVAGAFGNDNTMLGFATGGNESGSKNTYIGSQSGLQNAVLTQAITLGYNANNISSYTAVIAGATNLVIQASTPTINSCGSGSPSVVGTDVAGAITTGTGGPTSCSITFNQKYIQNPFCVSQTTFTATSAVVSAVSTTGMTVTTSAATNGATLNYVCIGRQ